VRQNAAGMRTLQTWHNTFRGLYRANIAVRTDGSANKCVNMEKSNEIQFDEDPGKRESQLHSMFDTLPAYIIVLSPTGEIEFFHQKLVEFTGASREALQNWENSNLIHPDDHAGVVQAMEHALRTGEDIDIEYRARRFDGTYRWFNSRGSPQRNENGDIVRWCFLLVDVDDRKKAEEELLKRQLDVTSILDSLPAYIVVLDPAGEIEFMHQNTVEYTGATIDEHRKWKNTDTIHPADRAGVVQALGHCLRTGEDCNLEYRSKRFDGVYRWFNSRGRPQRNGNGDIVRWCFLLVDIDDRKQAEEALQTREAELTRANQFMAIAQELSQTGSYSRVMDTDEQTLSDQMYRICEFDPKMKVTHEMVFSRVHPEDLPAVEASWKAALEAGTDITIAYRFVTDSGAVKHFRTISRPELNVLGQLTHVGATQDVTEIKRVEDAANQARAELAHVVRVSALNALAASIAHEVNQPLAGIITNASTCLRLLEADPPDLEGVKATAKRTIRDANRAADVIQHLRALFGRKELSIESLNLNDAAGEVLTLCSSELQHRRVTVQTDFAEDMPVVRGDRVQLQQVILNLILNAADAMSCIYETPRYLRVETCCDNTSQACLSVRDCGTGIDPGSIEKIFDAFYTTKTGGMGIGLSVSRSIIESHNGRLWATANEGPGATFVFSIPCEFGPMPDAHNPSIGLGLDQFSKKV
jgi:PAS domain S-box-containing protein